MISRTLLRSVRKNTKPRLHVRRISIGPGLDYSKPVADHTDQPVHLTAPPSQRHQQRIKLKMQQPKAFEELVFYPRGRANASSSPSLAVNAAFEAAIQQLNSLQSNAQTLRQSIAHPKVDTVADTIKYLERSGLPLSTVEQLSFIHIAGTKGKGSTCALVESILRQKGVHTGFFSSPHILSTNERIRIDGEPLAKHKFTRHFWHVYNRLMEQREHSGDMPAYFKFLTILSFHIFVEECVDVAVMEVGIGGEQDCTNVVRNVTTVGITSLGLEHTELLGNTLKQIAWQKAGIIKPHAHVFTHATQPECLEVIRSRASEQQATVFEVPPFEEYFQSNIYADYLGSCNDVIRLNGSLAIQLAQDWLRGSKKALPHLDETQMSEELLLGLRNCNWPGRCQLVEFMGMRLHLDGAHTVESMRVCTDWFRKSSSRNANPKILIFNRTGESDTKNMLFILSQTLPFDMVCFVPNVASVKGINPNQVMVRCSVEAQLKRAEAIAVTWGQLCASAQQPNQAQVYATLLDAFEAVRIRYPNVESQPGQQLDVLVTGSIHLLGAAIAAINELEVPANANGHAYK